MVPATWRDATQPEGSEGFRRFVAERRFPKVESATRFVVDSEFGDHVRILRSTLVRPMEPAPSLERLTEWELWGREEEFVLRKSDAASMVGVEPQLLLEGRVFIQVGGRTFEATGHVRVRAKQTYKRLLAREANPRRLRERR